VQFIAKQSAGGTQEERFTPVTSTSAVEALASHDLSISYQLVPCATVA
jgi:hypothetical protein